jgi:hypothetical protein
VHHGEWLDVGAAAEVEITSEDSAHPIEGALIAGGGGWRASSVGAQTIRLMFDAPMALKRIYLRFDEQAEARTQEFALRWSPDGGASWRPVLRQQFTFSPPGTTSEVEDYTLALEQVSGLELQIVPDISGGTARASLAKLRLA